MRKSEKINKAIAILSKKGDRISMIQADVLKERRTEVWVFEHFVRDMTKAEQDEEVYCAARDAAQYLTGRIELSELIPGYDEEEEVEIEEEMICVSASEFKKLVKRVDRLERRLGLKKEISVFKRKSVEEAPADDLIPQIEACKYVGCGKTTIKRWANNGFITGYVKGLNVYYSKRELDCSTIVKEHRMNKKEGKEKKKNEKVKD